MKINDFRRLPSVFGTAEAARRRHSRRAENKYDLQIENVPLETPPDLRFGEIATPVALQLARTLRKAPENHRAGDCRRASARSKVSPASKWPARDTSTRVSTAPPPLKMVALPSARHSSKDLPRALGHVLVEHTSINPNKAAHIGHLRNAILGDTFVRLLRAAGYKVDVQNYIDNTGVQVADVVVGFLYLEKKSVAEVRQIVADAQARRSLRRQPMPSTTTAGISMPAPRSGTAKEPPKNKSARKKIRLDTLHLLEAGRQRNVRNRRTHLDRRPAPPS